MASICPICSTENREGANFCRSCGVTLSAAAPRIPPPPPGPADREWATTAPAQLRAPTIPAPLFDPDEPVVSRGLFGKAHAARPADEKTVIVAPGQPPRPPSPPSSSSSRSERAERKRTRVKVPRPPEPAEPPLRARALWLWLGLLAVAVVMIVAGWYGYGTRKAPEPVEAPPPVAAPAPAVAPPAVELSPAAPAAAETPSAEPPAAEAAPTPPVAAPKPAPAAKPRKQANAAPQAGTSEAPAPATAPAPSAAPAPAASADPQGMCGDRNFIAKAQCMAAQCLKPEYKAHAQCEAVRRQQRIEEEKRNPTLLN
jgi:hypothetical protein